MANTAIERWLEGAAFDNTSHLCKTTVQQRRSHHGDQPTYRTDSGIQQTHHIVAMSSLSRRACYKCGNVGHYAEVCSSAERLCYNCKQPGEKHLLLLCDSFLTFPQDTNPAAALCQEPLRPSNVTTAKVLDTFRPTVQLYD